MSVVINDKTHEAVKKIRKLTYSGLIDFTEKATAIAKRKSPFKSGNNHDLIDWDEVHGSTSTRMFSQTGYGAYLELGTSKMPARPYFSPAIGEAIKEFDDGRKWRD